LINIYKQTYDTLTGLGYPVREQGSYGPQETLPDTHVTYFIVDQDDASHADNRPTSVIHSVQVALYSKDPAIVQAADQTLRSVMAPAGFLRGRGRALPFDGDTGHYGYVRTYNFYDMEG
jgi:hypothetical protein